MEVSVWRSLFFSRDDRNRGRVDIRRFPADELTIEELDTLVMLRESFRVVAVSNIRTVIEKIEDRIEKAGLKCHVISGYRSESMNAVAFGPVGIVGLGAAVGIGIHNLLPSILSTRLGKSKPAGVERVCTFNLMSVVPLDMECTNRVSQTCRKPV